METEIFTWSYIPQGKSLAEMLVETVKHGSFRIQQVIVTQYSTSDIITDILAVEAIIIAVRN